MSGLVSQLRDGVTTPSDKVLRHVSRAKIRLQISDPFSGAIVMQMPTVFTEALPTMATDGTSLYINPEFAESLSGDEMVGVLTHEVMHKIFFHHLRRNNRDSKIWNVSGDVIINHLLRNDGKTLPESGLDWDSVGELKRPHTDYSTEILADELISNKQEQKQDQDQSNDQDQDQDQGDQDQDQQDQGQGQGQGQDQDQGDPFADDGGTGIVIDAESDSGEPLSATEISQAERELASEIQNCAQIAKAQGKLPAHVAQYVTDLTTPTVDWCDEFARFLGKGSDHRSDWNIPDKKWLKRGIFQPRRVREGTGHVVIAIDTSASVSTKEYKALMAEAKSICLDIDAEKVTVIYCDTRIAHVDNFDDPSEITERDLGRYGGGGTDFAPPFQYVYENEIDVDSFVYLTDLEARMPEEPDYPVLWVSTTKLEADFGKTIHIN